MEIVFLEILETFSLRKMLLSRNIIRLYNSRATLKCVLNYIVLTGDKLVAMIAKNVTINPEFISNSRQFLKKMHTMNVLFDL